MPPCGCFGGLLESTPIPPTRAGANILIDAYNDPDLRPKGRNESGRYGRKHSHGVRLSAFDVIGAGVALVGMGIIVLGWRGDA